MYTYTCTQEGPPHLSVSALQSHDKTRDKCHHPSRVRFLTGALTLTGLRARRHIPEVILWPALRGGSASNLCPIGRATIFICHSPLKETMRQHDFFIGILVPQLEFPFLRIGHLVLHQVLSGGERREKEGKKHRERERDRARPHEHESNHTCQFSAHSMPLAAQTRAAPPTRTVCTGPAAHCSDSRQPPTIRCPSTLSSDTAGNCTPLGDCGRCSYPQSKACARTTPSPPTCWASVCDTTCAER